VAKLLVKVPVEFVEWLSTQPDKRIRGAVLARIKRCQLGNPGDHKRLGEGLSELRLTAGPGVRIYFTKQSGSLLILHAGYKGTQMKDIETARKRLLDDSDLQR